MTILTYFLQVEFQKAAGVRSGRSDALRNTISLETPLTDYEGDITLMDTLADPEAEQPGDRIIRAEYQAERVMMGKTLSDALLHLPERERKLIELVYFRGVSLTTAAPMCNYSSKQAADNAQHAAFYKLRHSSYTKTLRAALEHYEEWDGLSEGLKNSGLQSFLLTWRSSTELAAERHMKFEMYKCFTSNGGNS